MNAKIWIGLTAAGLFTAATAMAQGDARTGADLASASVRISVTIPGIVALEVPDEVTFDLAAYLKNSATVTPGEPCPDNVFPPPVGCSGAARFDPTSVKTANLEARGLSARQGESPLYLFSNGASGTVDLQASVEAAWSGAGEGPGFPTTALRVFPAAEGTEGKAAASGRHLAGAPQTLLSLPARSGGWRRLPLAFDLEIPDASRISFHQGTYTTVVTFTAAKA